MEDMMKTLRMPVAILCAIGAMNWGLDAVGLNIFKMGFVMNNLAMLVKPLKLVIGLAGVMSIVCCCMKCADSKSCSR